MGSMASGNRRMLNREMEVKAFSAVNALSLLTPTNTAKVARETCKKHQSEKKRDHPLLLLVFCKAFTQDSPGLEHS